MPTSSYAETQAKYAAMVVEMREFEAHMLEAQNVLQAAEKAMFDIKGTQRVCRGV